MSVPDEWVGAIHHLNCGTMNLAVTFRERLVPRRIVAHCLLVERDEGLLLVDTGFGMGDVRNPRRITWSRASCSARRSIPPRRRSARCRRWVATRAR